MPKFSYTEKMLLGSFCFSCSFSVSPTEVHHQHRLLLDSLEERIGGPDGTELSETPRQKQIPQQGLPGLCCQSLAGTSVLRVSPCPAPARGAPWLEGMDTGSSGHRSSSQPFIQGIPRQLYSLGTPGTADGVCAHCVYVPSHTHRMFRAVECPCTANTPDPVT